MKTILTIHKERKGCDENIALLFIGHLCHFHFIYKAMHGHCQCYYCFMHHVFKHIISRRVSKLLVNNYLCLLICRDLYQRFLFMFMFSCKHMMVCFKLTGYWDLEIDTFIYSCICIEVLVSCTQVINVILKFRI